MRVLLDTHAFLWYALDDPSLSARARAAILDPTFEKHVSAATIWEIAIKVALGKYKLEMPFDTLVEQGITRSGFHLLPILPRHASRLIGLQSVHRDPFDRMIVVQAMVDGLTIVSRDTELGGYGVSLLW